MLPRCSALRALPVLAIAAGCNWISLAQNAATYDTVQRGEAANIAGNDSLAYVTLAEQGIAIVRVSDGRTLGVVPPPAGTESVDDVALEGTLLFVLDARAPGHVSVMSLADSRHPRLVAGAIGVGVGPFSGVTARDGLAIVSGGTSSLTAWRYDTSGVLRGPVATADFGRGQPDAHLEANGVAVVSTHYWGPYFGIDIVRGASLLAKLPLENAGFTAGGAKPANFPVETAELDDRTVLVAHAAGLAMLDLRDAAHAHLQRVIDVGGAAVNVDVRGTEAAVVVARPAPAVVFVDFAGGSPRITRRVSLPSGTKPLGVLYREQHALVAARSRGVITVAR